MHVERKVLGSPDIDPWTSEHRWNLAPRLVWCNSTGGNHSRNVCLLIWLFSFTTNLRFAFDDSRFLYRVYFRISLTTSGTRGWLKEGVIISFGYFLPLLWKCFHLSYHFEREATVSKTAETNQNYGRATTFLPTWTWAKKTELLQYWYGYIPAFGRNVGG